MTNDLIDKAALALSGGLMLIGIIGLGIVEILAGKPYGASPMTNDAGEVIATPMVDPALRTGLVLLGLAILAVYGAYRFMDRIEERESVAGHETMAD